MSPRERQALSDVMDPATVVYQRGHYARRRAEALGASLPVVPLYGCLDAMCNREHFMSNRGRWHFDAKGPELAGKGVNVTPTALARRSSGIEGRGGELA